MRRQRDVWPIVETAINAFREGLEALLLLAAISMQLASADAKDCRFALYAGGNTGGAAGPCAGMVCRLGVCGRKRKSG